jgi:hypothetical protein
MTEGGQVSFSAGLNIFKQQKCNILDACRKFAFILETGQAKISRSADKK